MTAPDTWQGDLPVDPRTHGLSDATAAVINTYRHLLAPERTLPAAPGELNGTARGTGTGAAARAVGTADPEVGPAPQVALDTPVADVPVLVRPGVPAWLRRVHEVHASAPNPLVVATDLVLLTAAIAGLLQVTAAAATVATMAAAPAAAAATVLLGYVAGVYTDRDTVSTQGLLWYPLRTLLPVALGAVAVFSAGLLPGRRLGLVILVEVLALTGLRALSWLVLATVRRRGLGLQPTVILGPSDGARMLAAKLRNFPEAGLAPVAMYSLEDVLLGEGLVELVRRTRAEHVVLMPEASADMAVAATLRRFAGLSAAFSMVPPLPDLFLSSARVGEVGGVPLIPLGRLLRGRTTFPGKRLLDLAGAAVLLVLAAPVLGAAILAIRLDDGGPAFYRQRRVGRGGRTFDVLKLRSMVVDADRHRPALRQHNATNGLLFKLAADPRVTRVGRVIRKLSVDELPQLWNVLRGEMSLVGPRPLPVSPEDFGALENERHTVLPGITGYWQISGGNGLTYEEMVKLDLAYIHNWSLWLDVRLLLRTVPALLHRKGPY